MNQQPSHGTLYGGAPALGIPIEPLIINACLTGNVPTKQTSPHVPISVNEIIEDGLIALEAGASMLHLHARDNEGAPCWQPEIFARIINGIRRHRPEAILVVTTSGREYASLDKRAAVLELTGAEKPDMASLTLGSLNFPTQSSCNPPEIIRSLCERMRAREITPELEAFDLGMLNHAYYLQRKGFLPETCYINLILGNLGTLPGRIQDLASLVREIPKNWIWSGGGIGRHQLAINTASVLMGGHVRVGLEDNTHLTYTRMESASNRLLIERIVRLANEFGRPVAQCGLTRQKLKLAQPENWLATRCVIRKMEEADLPEVMVLLGRWNMAPILPSTNQPQPERDRIEISNTFVALLHGKLVGVASWLAMDASHAETASLAVDPDFIGCGIGYGLQQARLNEMRSKGIHTVRTEADRPEVIRWYIDKFGYRIVGSNPKKHDFGLPEYAYWTVLELELA